MSPIDPYTGHWYHLKPGEAPRGEIEPEPRHAYGRGKHAPPIPTNGATPVTRATHERDDDSPKVCILDQCPDPLASRGLCVRHYARWYKRYVSRAAVITQLNGKPVPRSKDRDYIPYTERVRAPEPRDVAEDLLDTAIDRERRGL